MEEAIEADELQTEKPRLPYQKNNNNYKITNKKNFTEEYEIYYRNGILSFDSFESLESLKEKCGIMNYEAIIYIIKNNDHYKGVKDNVKKIIKKISDISNNEEVSQINIKCSIGIYNNFSIYYRIHNHDYQIIGHPVRERQHIEFNEYIEELKINLVMLDMYIRKKIRNEYPELFI